MGDYLQLGAERKRPEVRVVDASDLEHVVWAYDDAVPLAFASRVIDDRGPCCGSGVAPFAGAVRVLGRLALFRESRCMFR